MKFFLTSFLFACLIAGHSEIFGQKPLPPPPPKAAPFGVETQTWQEFSSAEGGFKVRFPSTPKKIALEIETHFGKSPITQFQAMTSTGAYIASYLDFPAPVTDPVELKLRYDNGQERLLSKPGKKLLAENEFQVGTHVGREIVVEDEMFTTFHRMLVVEQRLFQMLVLTTNKYSKATTAGKAEIRKKADRFFSSFTVTKIPAPQLATPELPADFGLKLETGVLTSDYLGMTITLPRNWRVLDTDEAENLKSSAKDRLSSAETTAEQQIAYSLTNTKPLAILTKKALGTVNNTTVLLGAERVSFPNFQPLKMAQEIEKMIVEKMGEKILMKPQVISIDGVEFVRFEAFNSQNNLKTRAYLTNRKGLALQAVMVYSDDADAAILDESMNTIRFK